MGRRILCSFKKKRDYVVDRLQKMGFHIEAPKSTFYLWLNLETMPQPLDSGITFFEELLRERVIVVVSDQALEIHNDTIAKLFSLKAAWHFLRCQPLKQKVKTCALLSAQCVGLS